MIQQTHQSHLQLLLDEIRTGTKDAVNEIFNQYRLRLLNVAKSRISTSLQSRFDPDDVVQSAFIDFFQKLKQGEIQITTCTDLWRLLAKFTVNKTRSYIERELADKRSPSREQQSGTPGLADQRELAPAEALMIKEELQLAFEKMNSRDRRIIELHLRGANTNDIVEQFASCCTVSDAKFQAEITPVTVRRVLRDSRKCLRDQLAGR